MSTLTDQLKPYQLAIDTVAPKLPDVIRADLGLQLMSVVLSLSMNYRAALMNMRADPRIFLSSSRREQMYRIINQFDRAYDALHVKRLVRELKKQLKADNGGPAFVNIPGLHDRVIKLLIEMKVGLESMDMLYASAPPAWLVNSFLLVTTPGVAIVSLVFAIDKTTTDWRTSAEATVQKTGKAADAAAAASMSLDQLARNLNLNVINFSAGLEKLAKVLLGVVIVGGTGVAGYKIYQWQRGR